MTAITSQRNARWAAAAGVSAVVLAIVGDAIGGFASPKVSDSATSITASLHAHRTGLMVGAAFTGLSAALFVWIFVALTQRIRAAGQPMIATTALAAIVMANTLATVPDALLQATAHLGTPTVIKAAFVTSQFFVTKAFWFGSVAILLIAAGGRGGALPPAYTRLSAVVGVVLVLGAIATGSGGALAAGGPLSFIAFIALMAYVVVSSVMVWRDGTGA
jgi:hypothetical protein